MKHQTCSIEAAVGASLAAAVGSGALEARQAQSWNSNSFMDRTATKGVWSLGWMLAVVVNSAALADPRDETPPAVASAVGEACSAANIAIAEARVGYVKAARAAFEKSKAASVAAESADPTWTDDLAAIEVAAALSTSARAAYDADPTSGAALAAINAATRTIPAANTAIAKPSYRAVMLALKAEASASLALIAAIKRSPAWVAQERFNAIDREAGISSAAVDRETATDPYHSRQSTKLALKRNSETVGKLQAALAAITVAQQLEAGGEASTAPLAAAVANGVRENDPGCSVFVEP